MVREIEAEVDKRGRGVGGGIGEAEDLSVQ